MRKLSIFLTFEFFHLEKSQNLYFYFQEFAGLLFGIWKQDLSYDYSACLLKKEIVQSVQNRPNL